MVTQRYLVRLAYIGTRFSGIQRQHNKQRLANGQVVRTVQDEIETCLSKCFNPQSFSVHCSSRTDAGVHALNSAIHIDIDCHSLGGIHDPDYISKVLNRYFQNEKLEARVRNILPVSPSFHSRHCASSRTYLYRLAVYNGNLKDPGRSTGSVFPITEWQRAYLVGQPFDVEKAKEGAKLFLGLHDFRSFASPKIEEGTLTLRALDDVSILPGRPLMDSVWDSSYDNLTFWDVRVKGKGFLRNQVRRIVGALTGIAKGKLAIEKVKYLLENPGGATWDNIAPIVPPYGLYLANVEYPPEVLERDYVSPYELEVQRKKLEEAKEREEIEVEDDLKEEVASSC